MKNLLICPDRRPTVGLLAETVPLSNVRLLGQGLLEYWLSHLACHGAEHVLVLAHDRPEQVQALVGDGARWGLHVRVQAEARELTPAEAERKYGRESQMAPDPSAWLASDAVPGSHPALDDKPAPAIVLDHFPGFPNHPLFTCYADWFAGLLAWMSHAITPDRVGVRELRPGIWVGLRSSISPAAQLHAPCWLGKNVYVGPHAVVGPETILEDGALVEPGAEVLRSRVGPHTYVGKSTRIADSLAWGNTLLNWRTKSVVRVADPFVLCGWRQLQAHRADADWLARLGELCTRHKTAAALLWKHLPLHKES